MKKTIALVGLSALLLTATAASADEKRGIYLDVGFGAATVNYPGEVDDIVDTLEDNGFDRVTLSLDVSFGWAVLQNTYLVGSITGFADRLDNDDDHLQLNTYLTGVGVRLYPLASQKHLQLGVDVGIARLKADSSEGSITSDNGSGAKISIAYDFDSTLKGPAFMLGAQFIAARVEGETYSGAAVFARFVLK